MAKPYFPLYTGDYLRDTRGLCTKGHGAYLLLLLHLWDQDNSMAEKPILIRAITGLSKDEYRTIWTKKLRPFFTIENGVISHRRVGAELEKRAKNVHKARAAGAKGGKKTQQKQRRNQADAKASQVKDLTSATYVAETSSLSEEVKMDRTEPSTPAAADSALSPLSGQGLSADDFAVWREVSRQATLRPTVSLRDVDQIKSALVSLEGSVFTVGKHGVNEVAFRAVQAEAEAFGYQLLPEAAPVVRLVSGGQS